ncbi:thiol:disulfide interchange protein [Bradyrhizobium nanningense]|uniref:Thiol:disulfide interchange protein n=1 Tax=Bradyrhizobium nanningense TaxID=1325118 RepID=A0A4Q0RZR6_9BRAD|nr:DsbE family thiol:disulfide interchange protein [Bradyrhizobium nanningense]RXH24182.1 thiol:disulfide interchange protein [Bradyrhizobium nanningense]RXH29262.1 thiol:disulfide interchange protein [Bradyrhizobium nanningense]
MSKTPTSIYLAASAVAPRRSLARLWVIIPLLVFFGIAALLLVRLGAGDPSLVHSALIGKPAPQFALEPLDGLSTSGPPGLSSADLQSGHVTIVNVFASWCLECREEQGELMALANDRTLQREGVKLVGMVYKDDPKNALAYLAANGNPFAQVGTDRSGRTGIDFGVYGVPETYVIKGDGTIAYKLVGGISDASRPALMVAIAKAERP